MLHCILKYLLVLQIFRIAEIYSYVNSTRSNNFNEHFTIRELYFCLEWPKKKKRPHSVSWQQTHQTSGWQPWWRWYHPHGKSIHHNLNSDVLCIFICLFVFLKVWNFHETGSLWHVYRFIIWVGVSFCKAIFGNNVKSLNQEVLMSDGFSRVLLRYLLAPQHT